MEKVLKPKIWNKTIKFLKNTQKKSRQNRPKFGNKKVSILPNEGNIKKYRYLLRLNEKVPKLMILSTTIKGFTNCKGGKLDCKFSIESDSSSEN